MPEIYLNDMEEEDAFDHDFAEAHKLYLEVGKVLGGKLAPDVGWVIGMVMAQLIIQGNWDLDDAMELMRATIASILEDIEEGTHGGALQ